jgi:hypothetical protein
MNQQKFIFPTSDQFSSMRIKPVGYGDDTHYIKTNKRDLNKEYKLTMLERANILGIQVVHIRDSYSSKGGMTIAFRKSSQYKSGRMVDLSIATCSIEDQFSKSIGVVNALEKFFDGETVQMPLLNSFDDDQLSEVVKVVFTRLYNSV